MTKTVTTQGRQFVETHLSKGSATTGETLFLLVKSPTGKTLTVDATLDRPLKQAILSALAKDSISPEAFGKMDAYVLHEGKVLDLGKKVADSGLSRDATLHVMMRLRGGAGGNPLTNPPDIPDDATHLEYALTFANQLKAIPGFRNGDLLVKYIMQMGKLSTHDGDLFNQNAVIEGDDQAARMNDFSATIENLMNRGRLNKREGTLLKWMLGTKKESRGERGIGMKMADDGTISGRPPFSTYTKDFIDQVQLSANIDTNMRHVVAWHTIRGAYNKLIATAGKDAVLGALGDLLRDKIGQVPDKLKAQLDGKITQLIDDQVLTGADDPARFAFQALYVMNSSVENLWKGDAASNQALPQIQVHSMRVLEEVIGTIGAQTINQCIAVAKELAVQAKDAEQRGVGYATALFDLSLKIEQQLQDLEIAEGGLDADADIAGLADYLRRLAKVVCLPAEIDLIPTDAAVNQDTGDSEPAQVLRLGQKSSVQNTMSFLTGDDVSTDNIMGIFASLLTFDELS